MITVYLMTATDPIAVPLKASSVKITERGFLQCYDDASHLVATFAAWAYWLDASAVEEKETVLQ